MIVITFTISIFIFVKSNVRVIWSQKTKSKSLTHQPQQKTVAFQESHLRHVVCDVNWEFCATHWLR